MKCVVVAVAEEQQEVELGHMSLDMRHERGAGWSLFVQPLEFVTDRVRLIEDTLGGPAEHERVAFSLHRKAPNRNVVDALFAGR